MKEMWITYSVKQGVIHAATDWDPSTYYNLAFFDNELAALRHANKVGAKAMQVFANETIEDAIKNVGQR